MFIKLSFPNRLILLSFKGIWIMRFSPWQHRLGGKILERLGSARIFDKSKLSALFSVRNRLQKSAGKFDLSKKSCRYKWFEVFFPSSCGNNFNTLLYMIQSKLNTRSRMQITVEPPNFRKRCTSNFYTIP